MKSYFTALLFSAVAGGIAAALVGKPYEKHLRYLAALICTAVIVAPIVSLVPKIELSFPKGDSIELSSCDLVAEQAAEDAEVALKNYIFSETGIKAGDVSIEIERVEGQLFLRGVRVKTLQSEQDTVKGCLDALLGDTAEIEVYW